MLSFAMTFCPIIELESVLNANTLLKTQVRKFTRIYANFKNIKDFLLCKRYQPTCSPQVLTNYGSITYRESHSPHSLILMKWFLVTFLSYFLNKNVNVYLSCAPFIYVSPVVSLGSIWSTSCSYQWRSGWRWWNYRGSFFSLYIVWKFYWNSWF